MNIEKTEENLKEESLIQMKSKLLKLIIITKIILELF